MAQKHTPEIAKEGMKEVIERRTRVLEESHESQVALLDAIDKQRKTDRLQPLPDYQEFFA